MFLTRKSIFLFILLGGFVLIGWSTNYSKEVVSAYNSKNLIRLHVIANSDTPSDQELKRHVRDAVLASVGQRLAEGDNIISARQCVSFNLDAITAAAEAQIRSEGKDYDVKTEFGDFYFPTRAYGDIVLPAGEYESVKLIIGKGEGQNWWCVLFPPLCLVDVAGKSTTKDDIPVIKHETEETVQVRWKIVEVFKKSKENLIALWH
ncbi:MAG: stage sporulation protein [Clostridia bacterium]|nr:stage sporulation protein [Clostridia bacterium]